MNEVIYDLCVVGAGFFGCAAARHASANPNLRICLIGLDEPKEHEVQHREIFSSHYDEGRCVKVISSSPAYQILSKQSIQLLIELEKISGMKFYDPVGFMRIGKRGDKLMKHLQDVSAAVGTILLDMPDKAYMKKMYPFLHVKDDEYAILDFGAAGIINARKVLEAEKSASRKQGCHILVDKVEDVSGLKENAFHTITTSRNGKIKSKRVLFTTGAFTNINEFHVLPQLEMYMYKEMVTLVRIPDSEAETLSIMPGMLHKRNEEDVGSYLLPPVQYPDGRYYLKIGSMAYDYGKGMQTVQEIKNWFLSKEVPGETREMSQLLFKILPGLNSDGLFRKICVTSETPSGYPYIERIAPTITIAVAGNGWGASIGEEVGRLAACLSLTGNWNSQISHSLFEITLKED